ncbi:hypothetical protein [Photobacterium profundum]|uniref:hypothetical protein n=1 Tax=Photobacterium profundum TaxID=74109 RepID=UPI001E60DD7C
MKDIPWIGGLLRTTSDKSVSSQMSVLIKVTVIYNHRTIKYLKQVPLVAIDGANALKITAAMWIDCGVSKNLIYDLFFDRYKSIYCQLFAHTMLLPDVDYCGKDLITETVKKVYAEMSSWSV